MKIVIIGYSGTGKTTLANALAKALQCEIFRVDDMMYDKNMEQREASAAMAIAEQRMAQLAGRDWIMDGYRIQCVKEEWLRVADRIVFLDLGKWTCFCSVLKRLMQSCMRYAGRIVRRAEKSPKLVSQTTEQKQPVPSTPPSLATLAIQNMRHLLYIIRVEHQVSHREQYMKIGRGCPEKFVVLRNRREVKRFQRGILEECRTNG